MLICSSIQLSNNLYSKWTIKNQNSELNQISWANFTWTNGYLGDKYFEKTAMLIPCKISDIENLHIPTMDEVEAWARHLAYCQFTEPEMRIKT